MVVPDYIEDGEDDMKSVEAVESDEKVIEADSFLVDENYNGEDVTDDSQGSQGKHHVANKVRVGLEEVPLVNDSHVFGGIVAAILVVMNCNRENYRISPDGVSAMTSYLRLSFLRLRAQLRL